MSINDLAKDIYNHLVFETSHYGEYPDLSADEYQLISRYRNDTNFTPANVGYNPKLKDDEMILLSKYRAQVQIENQMREEQKRHLLHLQEMNLRRQRIDQLKQKNKNQPSMSDDDDIGDLGFGSLSLDDDSKMDDSSPKSYSPRKLNRKRKSQSHKSSRKT